MKVLKPKQATEVKQLKFVGFDVETDPNDKNKFICACLYSDDFQLTFYDEESLIQELKNKKYREYKFIATNLPFDFFASFQDRSRHISITERNGRIYKSSLYQQVEYNEDDELIRRKPLHFYDTLNYIPCSVEKLGKIVGNPKMEHPYFFPKHPKNDIEMQMLVDYCMNDAKISCMFMRDIVAHWLEENNLSFKMTIAGIAMEDFVTNYLDEKLFQESTEIHKRCFAAYYGGRTEVFKRGKAEDVFCYDVNSLYPSAMLEEYPHPNTSKEINQSSEYIINNYEGVTKVKVFVPKMKIPPLPYRKSKGDKLIFPCGTFEGFYCHNELRNAIKYGVQILEYHEGVIYTRTKKFFKKFVLTHYDKRKVLQQLKNPLEIMEKGAMNNLYGKWALNYTESTVLQHKDDKIDMQNVVSIEPVGDYLNVKREGYDDAPEYSFPIFSAYTTAYARINMYGEMVKCQDELLYTDTDSIFTESQRNSSKELGEFKLEDGYPKRSVVFIRPKVYIKEDYDSEFENALKKNPDLTFDKWTETEKYGIKLKGMSRIKKVDWDKIINGETVYQERFMKHRTAIRKKSKGDDARINEVITVPKHLSLEDDKRVWKNKFNPDLLEESEPIVITD